MQQSVPEEAIERIQKMEACFDSLLKAAHENPSSVRKDPDLHALLICLTGYFESGQWLRDYELDEKGLLPPSLKRGVLSQDAVYNFLEELNDAPD